MTFNDMDKDIARTKARLMTKKVCENFGEKEYRRLRDKYAKLADDGCGGYGKYCEKLTSFNEWCMNYTGF